MPFYPRRAPQREKTITIHAPCCGAAIPVTYDGTGGEGWERDMSIPGRCPKGHALPAQLTDALEEYADQQADEGVGDDTADGRCWYSEAQR